MGIAMTVREYLEDFDIEYDIVEHPPSITSIETARQAHLPAGCLAKCVLIKDENGTLSLAVIPSDRIVNLPRVKATLGHAAEIAPEIDVIDKFDDCDFGAIPPIGNAYGLRVLLDESLIENDDIFLEAGDHQELIHVNSIEFQRLMGGAIRGSFSYQA